MSDEIAVPDTLKFKRKTARVKLTKRTIEGLRPPAEVNGRPAQSWTFDTTTPRLAVCTWSSGAKSWYWYGRGPDARVIRLKLGEYPEVTPEQARKLAAKTSADVAAGIDPRAARRELRSKGLTLAEAFARYLDGHAKPKKAERSWTDDEKVFNRYCGSLKSRILSAVERSDVAALHARVGTKNGKVAANRLLSLLSKVFSYAGTALGFTGGNPAKGVEKFRETARDRFLSADELQRFFASLAEEPQLFQDFFTLLLLTGARRGNVAAMRFEELDLTGATWRIPTTKNGEPLRVHLVKEAVEILQRRHADSGGRPWVFEGGRKNPTGHLTDPKGSWARVVGRAGLADVHIHDLRRTLGSWQAATGASLPVIGKSLGHKSQSTTQIYARLNLDPVRESVNTAVAAMLAAGRGPTTGGTTAAGGTGGDSTPTATPTTEGKID